MTSSKGAPKSQREPHNVNNMGPPKFYDTGATVWSRGHSVVTGSQCGHGVTVWSRGHSVVTGSPKTIGCGHRITEGFLVWSRGHRRLLGWVPKSPEDFWCGHGVTKIIQHCRMGHGAVLCRAEFARTFNGAASA